jgi:hypothetical protein
MQMTDQTHHNHYFCEDCQISWYNTIDCAGNDKCPRCKKVYQPFRTIEVEPLLTSPEAVFDLIDLADTYLDEEWDYYRNYGDDDATRGLTNRIAQARTIANAIGEPFYKHVEALEELEAEMAYEPAGI